MKTEVMTITPAIAQEWLKKNTKNRRINSNRVTMYADEMKKGRWVLHHQGVAFYEDGTFADGQHRLAAIVQSGCAVDMSVTFGLSKASGIMIDSHQARSVSQSIQMSGVEWIDKDVVAIINLLWRSFSGVTIKKISNLHVVEFAEAHKSSLMFAKKLKTNPKRKINPACVMAAFVTAFPYENKEILEQCYEVLYTGMPRSNEDKAIILLREWLMNESSVYGGETFGKITLRKTQRAIMAFCQRQPINKLYEPQDFLYKPLTDAEIPKRS